MVVGTVARNKHDMVQQLPEKDAITYISSEYHYCGYCKRLAGWGLVMKLPHVDSNWYQLFIVYHSGGSYAQAHLAFCHLQYP